MWVTGREAARRMRWGRSIAIHRERRRGRVETMTSSASSRAGDLADRVHRHRVDHLAVGLDPGLPEPVELVL
jgi:hypothetical protein